VGKNDDRSVLVYSFEELMTLIGGWNARMDAAQAQTEFADIRASDMRVFGQLRGQDMRL
jgi:hypothetical protein